MTYPLEVTANGAICLGEKIACDGFKFDVPVRVQTHVHDDHMAGFDESKGFQDILMSRGTYELLIAEFDADLPLRENLYPLDYGVPKTYDHAQVTLLPSGHMLGAAQVLVENAHFRLGYSGDFVWPLDNVIEVDALVVDSTYGSPDSVRKFTQPEAEAALLRLLQETLRFTAVHMHAHRGTIERALQLMSTVIAHPVIVSPLLSRRIAVFQKMGYPTPMLLVRGTRDATEAARAGRVVHLYSTGDRKPVDYGNEASIILSAYTVTGAQPYVEYSERSFRVALTDHADYRGTLEYVAATGAKFVLVDNARGGHAVELAGELHKHLGVRAIASHAAYSRAWGV